MPSRPSIRPIESDLVEVLRGATAQRTLTDQIAERARRDGVTRVVFVGVGGSWASSVPATTLMASKGAPFSAENINATEFTDLYLDGIGEKTLVIASSHSGGTPETVMAARAAADRGALVVSVSSATGNPLADAAEFNLVYGSERTITSAKYVLLTELSYSLFEAYGVEAETLLARGALDAVPEATLGALLAVDDQLGAIAERYAKSDNLYVLASGPLTGLAYMLSVCYLVEQQWMKSTHFFAADFFHGPFELAQDDQPYIVLCGQDASRPQTDRVVTFLRRYHDEFAQIDVAAMPLGGILDDARQYVGHIPMATVVARLADHFEAVTGHDLDTRIYMHRAQY